MEQPTVVKKNSKCHFCGISKNDFLRYGPIYKLGKITAHYYCLLLSNRLFQNGNDDEGILGFLVSDIQDELRRTSNIPCIYCKRGSATIMCAASKCKKSFHLPCGLKNGSSHQFANQFKSFCHTHRLIQNIPGKILKEAYKSEVICCICQEQVNVRMKRGDILWAPCCLKAWYHRNCVQKLAHSAGYFCRCPACNDAKKFNECMQRFGIFIPQQDASWELVPNAFEDLLFRYNNCDAVVCKCPGGRQTNTENTMWEIVLCESCGSQGMHVACGDLKLVDPEWECTACRGITKNVKSSVAEVSDYRKTDEGSSKQVKLLEVGQKKRRRSTEDLENSVLDKRKKSRTNVEEDEEEIEVDVETVDEETKADETSAGTAGKSKEATRTTRAAEANAPQKTDWQEVFNLLRPGPLSYKLSMARKLLDGLPIACGKPTAERKKVVRPNSEGDVIELSDSEEEMEADSDVEIIEEKTEQTAEGGSKHTRVGGEKRRTKDLEVVAMVSLHPEKVKKQPESSLGRLIYLPEPVPNNRHRRKLSVTAGKELMQVAEADVIILTD